MLQQAVRLFHTLRWLRPAQVTGRAWRYLYRPRPDTSPAPPLRVVMGRWPLQAWRTPLLVDPTTLQIHSQRCSLARPADWNNEPACGKLRLYHLHYFDDLLAHDASRRGEWHRTLISRWIAENPPPLGNGWEPYPLSLRLVNWIAWHLNGESSLPREMVHSLAVQARYLHAQPEHHLLGNHLWTNAKALVFAGVCFAGEEADRWRSSGLCLLRRELAEQLLADGGHFERSPMYHAIVLQDLLDLIALARCYPCVIPDTELDRWRTAIPAMLRWLAVMTHTDGDIALFNDAAFDAAPRLRDLAAAAADLGIAADIGLRGSLHVLADTGYVRLQNDRAVLIADVGDIGPDYLPGHAHADTLSYELTLDGRRLVVDAGTSRYEVGAQRAWERGTSAHNTVTVDGQDSSEVWSSFRVARRARVSELAWGDDGDTAWLSAAHDGYRRLRGDVVHRRRWRLSPHGLAVSDALQGRYASAVARVRFAPGCELAQTDVDGATIGGVRLAWRATTGPRFASGTWHPRFGCSLDCLVLEMPLSGAALQTEILWS